MFDEGENMQKSEKGMAQAGRTRVSCESREIKTDLLIFPLVGNHRSIQENLFLPLDHL